MRPLLPAFVVAALAACEAVPPAEEDESRPDADPPITAEALEVEVGRLTGAHGGGDDLWPGFDPLAVPLAVYDGEQTFLFRHPSPPDEFAPASSDPAAHVRDGRHEEVFANTAVDLGGTPTATILLDAFPPEVSLAEAAGIAIHEAFHAFQRERYPDWGANETDLLTYPATSAELLALRRLETRALAGALAADGPVEAACRAREALALRRDRFSGMDPAFASYERGTELNEGLALFVERRAAGRAVELPEEGFPADAIRQRSLAAGAALATLLDRFEPGWRATMGTGETETLDRALLEAIGPGDRCSFGDEVVAEAGQAARRDVVRLEGERADRLVAFDGAPGRRVVVEAAQDAPLRLQGFDPVNVEPLDGGRLLHTRFLRLGNESGSLEVLDAHALTEGAGGHPIFEGVGRLVLTGLEAPEVTGGGEGVPLKLDVPGLTLEFESATAAEDGRTLTVRLGG